MEQFHPIDRLAYDGEENQDDREEEEKSGGNPKWEVTADLATTPTEKTSRPGLGARGGSSLMEGGWWVEPGFMASGAVPKRDARNRRRYWVTS